MTNDLIINKENINFLISYLEKDLNSLRRTQHKVFTEIAQRRACGSHSPLIIQKLTENLDNITNLIKKLDENSLFLKKISNFNLFVKE